MKTVCEPNLCNGCMACINKCSQTAISIVDEIKYLNAVIDETKCVNCGLCEKTCPQLHEVSSSRPLQWYQGWAMDESVRKNSSSGGAAACITKAFIEKGGYCCSCVYENGDFIFRTTNSVCEAQKYAGSKYVKSNPENAYKEIKTLLNCGNQVLFIGLPCQVAGLKNYFGNSHLDNLYTVDLICHGTPSARVLDLFLKQKGVELKKQSSISFRGISFGIQLLDEEVALPGTVDAYTLSFLNSINYTSNCYSCKYASLNRVSDITIGDNWGTDLIDELRNGISLILINSEKGSRLISDIDLEIKHVDENKAIAANGQLSNPSQKPPKYKYFMNSIIEGKDYDSLVKKIYPKQYWRQIIKGYAIKLHIKKV